MNKYLTIKADIEEKNNIKDDFLIKLIESGASKVERKDNSLIIQCSQKDLDNLKDILDTQKINHTIIKTEIFDTTLISSGTGNDPDHCVEVSLTPAPKLTRLKLLDIIFTKEVNETTQPDMENFIKLYPPIVRNILKNGSVTDSIFTIRFMDLDTDLDEAVRIAAINALIDSNGIREI